MNNKLKKLIVLIFAFLFVIFLISIFIKKIETNKSDISNMSILDYIPSNYEHTILSNSTNNDIKRYINDHTSAKKRDELNRIKDGIISYLGFNLQKKIEDIYDNEFALSFFENKLKKVDTLLIFKLKKNIDINQLLSIREDLNKSDEIIELKRFGKLNYISHIFQTKDNYIIASSNAKLIKKSLKSNEDKNKNFSRNLIPDDINLKEIKLLLISQYINPKNDLNFVSNTVNKQITIFNLEDKKIRLRSFSQNIDKLNIPIINNKIDNIKDIIFTDKYSTYKENLKFLYNDIDEKEFLKEAIQTVNEELLIITNNNNWVLCFKNKLPNKISIDQLDYLKPYKKEDLYLNNINYSIYTNDRLKIKDNNIIYEKKSPFFGLQDKMNTYISNDFDALINITKKPSISDQYLNNNNEIKPYKYILNDMFFIKDINNKLLVKYFKSLKNLQYFINNELLSLEDININISHTIPELHEKVYLESNLKIL